jgi:hypothetical protein
MGIMKWKLVEVARIEFQQNVCKNLWDAWEKSIYGRMETKLYYAAADASIFLIFFLCVWKFPISNFNKIYETVCGSMCCLV